MKKNSEEHYQWLGNKVVNPYRNMTITPISEEHTKDDYKPVKRISNFLMIVLLTLGYLVVLTLWVLFALWFHTHVSEYMVLFSPFIAALITAIYLYKLEEYI